MGFFTEYLPPQPILKVLSNDFCMHITYPIIFFDSIFTFEGNGLKKASKFYHLKPIIHFWIFCIFFSTDMNSTPPPFKSKKKSLHRVFRYKTKFYDFFMGAFTTKSVEKSRIYAGKMGLGRRGNGEFFSKGQKTPML